MKFKVYNTAWKNTLDTLGIKYKLTYIPGPTPCVRHSILEIYTQTQLEKLAMLGLFK